MSMHRTARTLRRSAGAFVAALMLGLFAPSPATAAREGRSCDEAQPREVIAYGDVIRCEIRPAGESDRFRFVGGRGDTVRVQITDRTGSDATPCFRVRDPDGDSLASRRCGDRGRDLVLTRTGIHEVQLTERTGEQRVRYTVALDRVQPTSPAGVPINHGQRRTDEINPRGDLDLYFFAAAPGDEIGIRISDRSGGSASPCYQLHSPEGTALTDQICGSGNNTHRLEMAGRYSILITEEARRGQQEVEYRVQLTCRRGDCPSHGLRNILGCIAARGTPFRNGRIDFLQPNRPTRTDTSDASGCAGFIPVSGRPFEIRMRGRD